MFFFHNLSDQFKELFNCGLINTQIIEKINFKVEIYKNDKIILFINIKIFM